MPRFISLLIQRSKSRLKTEAILDPTAVCGDIEAIKPRRSLNCRCFKGGPIVTWFTPWLTVRRP